MNLHYDLLFRSVLNMESIKLNTDLKDETINKYANVIKSNHISHLLYLSPNYTSPGTHEKTIH